MLRIIYTILLIVLLVSILSFLKQEQVRHLQIVKEVTDSSAHVVWSKSSSEGTKHLTLWNNNTCMGIIVVRRDYSYYVTDSICSSK